MRLRYLKKNQIDGDNGFKVKADCYNLRIEQLDKIQEKKE